ncbi:MULTISPECIES: helix-turn-helix domain-containing protein [Pasteurellaceae]|uniref:Transcriptional regulator n=2 Tax=Rodentibacter TaxID=1960084 RepID=A0A1V3JML3_9PAST|nr:MULTISPECIES: helix-turn-helix domain-containing protein [Rodentibacter]MBF0750886.1 helix-turn-helix domain-containing protein [Pasteurella sp. 19428wF3_WM03]OOF38205.1 transcriptional regulator [Rodentibacter mrazii]OOF57647.1 transcriptional regulator [Rodentibacter genomosp. 2]TFU53150.1 helix-turn-helix domain-containing protein [Pasteurella sp. WM03]
MTKRNLFNELMTGLKEIQAHQKGEIELPSYTLNRPEPLEMKASEIKAIRESLKLSQSMFAQKLRTSVRTYQGWEQGKSKPNQQAMLLLRMVERSPQIFEELARV